MHTLKKKTKAEISADDVNRQQRSLYSYQRSGLGLPSFFLLQNFTFMVFYLSGLKKKTSSFLFPSPKALGLCFEPCSPLEALRQAIIWRPDWIWYSVISTTYHMTLFFLQGNLEFHRIVDVFIKHWFSSSFEVRTANLISNTYIEVEFTGDSTSMINKIGKADL